MIELFAKYEGKFLRDRSALSGRIAFAANDDVVASSGPDDLRTLASDIASRLSSVAVAVVEPSLPFADFLLRRLPSAEDRFIPRDTETRTFLHDIPILRRAEFERSGATRLAELLGSRKGVVLEGVGIVAVGPLTVEQAYIHASSVFHAAFVAYLLAVLSDGFVLSGEREAFDDFRRKWLLPLTADSLPFDDALFSTPGEVLSAVALAGAETVGRGLVDSFFGNVSYRLGDTIYISQTASSLDELPGLIDPVPMDRSSTAGITASSEFTAHRKAYEGAPELRAILHGHPKFAVAMSIPCDETDCRETDCWRSCAKSRSLGGVLPIVVGEIGAGGLADRVPAAIVSHGAALVYGHGVFAGGKGFAEAFRRLVEAENLARTLYFDLLAGGVSHPRRRFFTEENISGTLSPPVASNMRG